MMRVTTLKAWRGSAGGMTAYYAGLARDQQQRDGTGRGPVDYYLDPNEPPGRWWGRGCAALGVGRAVSPEEMEALLEARHPETGERLGRGFGVKSARGFDATFSAPKSVSVLWALSDDPWIRAEVLAAHDTAVVAALDWFEEHGAVTRRGTDGVHQVDSEGVAVALFRQHTSRTIDPQIHTHAIIAAKVQDPTGRWLALDARFLKRQQRAISWLYAASLRSELTARLGVSWGPMEKGHADIDGVPAGLALRRGEAAAAAAYAAHGRLHSTHPALIADRVARQHKALSTRGEAVAITTASASTARAINVAIQQGHNPYLSGPSVTLADGTQAFVGDQIATRRNDASLVASGGSAVRNRQTWTVTAVGKDGSLTIVDDDRGRARLPADYVARHVELGWAVTGYGSQGVTVDHGICVIESNSSRAGIYVGMTRGRDRNVALLVDPTGLAEPEEAFAAAIARPPNSLSALAVREQLYRARGQVVVEDPAERAAARLARLQGPRNHRSRWAVESATS